MKMIIIAAAAILLLGGGGAGAYFVLVKPAEASTGDEAHKEVKKEKEKSKHTEYLELDPLVLPIVNAKGVSQVVSLVIALEVPDAKTKEELKSITPKLKDAFIQDMYGVLNEHAVIKGGVIQVNALKERLNKISKDVAGEDKIYDVLLQVVQQRPV
ncbi:MAG: flagellar basal body-associated FliL family protein [Micavibrio sp.]|nr:flagellar basal body-associated FliL family protein [Micavibrio sp.]